MTELRDYAVACDAAIKWLKENDLHIEYGILQALARVMIAAVDEARDKRQQEH